MSLTVLALGGNALLAPGQRGTAAEQRANLRSTLEACRGLFDGPVVVTHGNGPQVGNELLRQELGREEAPPLPLYLAVAQTQAEIGALIVAELAGVGRPAVVVLTHVVVDRHDPAFGEPTKPVGPFYGEERASELRREREWALREDSSRGWRRVVPSPRPRRIVEIDAVRALLERGGVVVAAGGGGIPVVEEDGRYDGVEAVIDKDHASALLAGELGADRLVILTQVAAVYRNFRSENRERVTELRPGRDDALLAELPAGSMRPKVEAAFDFVRATGREALITSAEALEKGEAGTKIVPASRP
jgi:carbamate kinase